MNTNRDFDALHAAFRALLEAWMKEAQAEASHVRLFVTETRRTEERQDWLFRQGRVEPYLDKPIVTNTMDSRHRWGLAADLAMQREDGSLIWSEDSWAWLYRVAPPERYGLRSLDPYEWLHLELWWADEAIREADALGLTRS